MAESETKSTIPTKTQTPGSFRETISEDSETFKPESGRYHLYIAFGCPYASRANLALKLKGLNEHIGLSIAHPGMEKTKPGVDDHKGWVFKTEVEGCIPDTVNNFSSIRELYEAAKSPAQKYSVPVLWDKKNKTIVNNESADIIRILNSGFNKFAKNPGLDLYPETLRKQIDEIGEWVSNDIAVGVYKAGFAQAQEPYEQAVNTVFKSLDRAEEILAKSRYLAGNQFTEADIKFFVVLVRFDEVYHILFKCNKKRIVDYPNLLNYARDIYQLPDAAKTVNMEHIKRGYYTGGPVPVAYNIIPVGNNFINRLKEKHDRDRF